MEQETNNREQQYKCPYCACIFLNKADLQKHLQNFSNNKAEHEYNYRKTHDRLERGYDEG